MRDPQFKKMLDLLAMLKKGYCDGVKVRVGRLQNLISSSCVGELFCFTEYRLKLHKNTLFLNKHTKTVLTWIECHVSFNANLKMLK